jgi:glycosyltransferase involved in cell wall biosynthesis
MISVCIPVFNADVRPLARQLFVLSGEMEVQVEILFFDDFSEETFRILNRQISDWYGITYREMECNKGRAAIRNLLGKEASQPWLLFLDADSLLPDSGFLKNYMHALDDTTVICGGTAYDPAPPEDKTRLLRWIYGSSREQLSASKRMSDNKFAITANNFLISKNLFMKTGFRETIVKYGHEDTLLGYDLFLKGIKIRHIDNPVIHTGLESSAGFLEKTRDALDNLLLIKNNMIHDPRFVQSSGLLRRLKQLESLKLTWLTAWFFRLFEPLMIRNLTGSHPSLLLLDVYRLGYLCNSVEKNPFVS